MNRLERAGNQREEAEEKGEKGRAGRGILYWLDGQFLAGPAHRGTTYQRGLLERVESELDTLHDPACTWLISLGLRDWSRHYPNLHMFTSLL